jgi:4-amino-4-deoxy-L-arabinose transferase-like glycosyltransferase
VEEQPLAPPGNPLRPRSLVALLTGFVALCVIFASDAHWAGSLPVGVLAALLATVGALDFAGCFDDAREPSLGSWSFARLGPRLLEVGGASACWLLAVRLAVGGSLPGHVWLAPLLVTLSSVLALVCVSRLAAALGSHGSLELACRPGFWLLLAGVLLYVPFTGTFSLLDPWETHYGEVAREMLARDDWLSLWWAQEGFFWSKPILDFWLQGLSFVAFGVRYRPDEMLSAAARGHLPQPEWAARLPVVLLTLVAVYLLYRLVARAAGERAGLLAGLVLLCVPYWSLLAHQSMTDMPYVAPLTAALSLFGLGLLTDPERVAPSLDLAVGKRRLRISLFHGLFALILLTALPQLAYLVSRNVTLQLVAPPYGFRWHLDEIYAGSGLGNCGIPGNEACRGLEPVNTMFQPALGAALFGLALGYLLHQNRGERRVKRLCYLAAWYFVSLAALAKGAPGLVLPLVVAAAVLVARRKWGELLELELAGLCLTFAAVCLPWYVQAFMRHGSPFTDRLLFHDMYMRAFEHVHDTNAGTDVSLRYYIWQLGYGLFPWTGLAAAGVSVLYAQSQDADPRRRELCRLLALWLLVSFSLFTLSLTKFHHYALPCTPPLAVAAALLLDRALGDARFERGKRYLAYLGALSCAALLLIYGILRSVDGSLLGAVDAQGDAPAAAPVLAAAAIAGALVLTWLAARRWSRPVVAASDAALGVFAILAAMAILLVARDLSTSLNGDVPASARLLHLITYNYKRSWPLSLDFEAITWAFGVAAAVTTMGLAWRVVRREAAVLLVAVGVWFCAFTLWVYLPSVARHFGQRELLLAYYRARKGPEEPVVAYQMNWKGENFYTGNRLPAFVSSGKKFKNWLKAQQKAGRKVVFFLTEHGRIGTLKGELGVSSPIQRMTDKSVNDKFALVRAELGPRPDTDSSD